MQRLLALLGAVTVLALSGPTVMAVVTIDSSGNGFVGKGDVQTPFGWNNPQLQDNAAGVTFYFEDEEEYSIQCRKDEPTIVVNTRTRTRGVDSTVDAEVRKNTLGKVNGFILNGFDDTGDVEPYNLQCVGQPSQSGFEYVEDSLQTGGFSGGRLYATHDQITHLIWEASAE